jgi:putative transposase
VSLPHAHLEFRNHLPAPGIHQSNAQLAETTMRAVLANLNAELIEFNGETDHLHLLVAHPPTPAISVVTQRLKGRTAYQVRREFTGERVRARIRSHPWSPSHFAVSCVGAPYPSSSNTSTDKLDLFDRRAAPDDTRDGLTPP